MHHRKPTHNLVKVHGYLQIDDSTTEPTTPGGWREKNPLTFYPAGATNQPGYRGGSSAEKPDHRGAYKENSLSANNTDPHDKSKFSPNHRSPNNSAEDHHVLDRKPSKPLLRRYSNASTAAAEPTSSHRNNHRPLVAPSRTLPNLSHVCLDTISEGSTVPTELDDVTEDIIGTPRSVHVQTSPQSDKSRDLERSMSPEPPSTEFSSSLLRQHRDSLSKHHKNSATADQDIMRHNAGLPGDTIRRGSCVPDRTCPESENNLHHQTVSFAEDPVENRETPQQHNSRREEVRMSYNIASSLSACLFASPIRAVVTATVSFVYIFYWREHC